MKYVRHIKKSALEVNEQSVAEHLSNVSLICKANANKLGLGKAGELIGLLHDLVSCDLQHVVCGMQHES